MFIYGYEKMPNAHQAGHQGNNTRKTLKMRKKLTKQKKTLIDY